MMVAWRTLGPAYANLQWRKPREVWRGSASEAMGISTRMVARWLEGLGFKTVLEERRFGAWTLRGPHDPAVALCGVDNAGARADLGKANFELVV